MFTYIKKSLSSTTIMFFIVYQTKMNQDCDASIKMVYYIYQQKHP